jgi:hypothetical protein
MCASRGCWCRRRHSIHHRSCRCPACHRRQRTTCFRCVLGLPVSSICAPENCHLASDCHPLDTRGSLRLVPAPACVKGVRSGCVSGGRRQADREPCGGLFSNGDAIPTFSLVLWHPTSCRSRSHPPSTPVPLNGLPVNSAASAGH